MNCKDCKWWDQEPIAFLTRVCHNPMIVPLISDEDCLADGIEHGYNGDEDTDGHFALLAFGPEFGCVHFATKEGTDGND